MKRLVRVFVSQQIQEEKSPQIMVQTIFFKKIFRNRLTFAFALRILAGTMMSTLRQAQGRLYWAIMNYEG